MAPTESPWTSARGAGIIDTVWFCSGLIKTRNIPHNTNSRVKQGNLGHKVIWDGGWKAVSTTSYTHYFLPELSPWIGSSAVASVARQLNRSRSKGLSRFTPVCQSWNSVPNYPALPYIFCIIFEQLFIYTKNVVGRNHSVTSTNETHGKIIDTQFEYNTIYGKITDTVKPL